MKARYLYALPVRCLVGLPLVTLVFIGEAAEMAWNFLNPYLPRGIES